jgi:molybdenum cofactor cytidylyltransferase
MKVAAVLLAAGLSTRFGGTKLTALLDGRPLGLHAASTLAAAKLDSRIVVTGAAARLSWPGFAEIPNTEPAKGMSGSIRLGVSAARRGGADVILIALADMPYITLAHIEQLIASCDGPGRIIASSLNGQAMPPAIFGGAWFPALEALEGDRGAGMLLRQADLISAPPDTLLDVDYPSDLSDLLS